MNFNKRIVKKVAATSLAAVIAAGTVGGGYYYYANTAYVQAEESDQEALAAIAENVLATTKASTGAASKEETVYVKADASGNVTKTTVSEWLKNISSGSVSDVSNLKDITNVKGDESFTEGKDGEITWDSEGNDIYYQGTTDEELPVKVHITYKLDGKEISPEKLAGKSGKLEIQFTYENNAKQTVNVNGTDQEMYVPFTMISAMMLDSDKFSM